MLVTLLCLVLLLLFVYYKYVKLVDGGKNIPTLRVIPLVTWIIEGLRILWNNDLRIRLPQLAHGFSKLAGHTGVHIIDVGLVKFAMFDNAEAVKELMNSQSALNKSGEYQFLEPWLRTGLLTSSDSKWKSRRKLLTPAFHFRILEDYMPIFEEQAHILVKKLEGLTVKDSIDIAPQITACTLDIICETAMGVHIKAQSGGHSEYIKAIRGLEDAFSYRSMNLFLQTDFIFFYLAPSGWIYRRNLKYLHEFTKKVIEEKKADMIKNSSTHGDQKPKRKPFLELLLEHHFKDNTFTDQDIQEEVDTFMFEGHDTTAMGISWTLYCLGLYPDIQEKVWEELDDIFQDNPERSITPEDLKNMKYLECVIKETLRLYPPVPLVARRISEGFRVLNCKIPTNLTCVIHPEVLHRDPEQFPNPEKFDPDRFLPENTTKRHPYAYVPFAAGPRNCIGQKFALMEEKVVISHVVRRFKLKSLDPRDKTGVLFGLIGKNATPLRLNLTRRE